MPVTVKRGLTVLVGVILAGVMLLLGLWQMSSYRRSMADVAAEREAMPTLVLADHVAADGTIDSAYGRRVTISGAFTDDVVLVGTQWPMRWVQDFRLVDGRTVPVVVGLVESPTDGPADLTTTRQVDLTGVFTAGDGVTDDTLPPEAPTGSLTSLRLQSLVQTWPQPMISGYVTLRSDDSLAFGLEPAQAQLPEGQGSAMHQGYALQWWVFAGAAIVFSIVVARGYKADDPSK